MPPSLDSNTGASRFGTEPVKPSNGAALLGARPQGPGRRGAVFLNPKEIARLERRFESCRERVRARLPENAAIRSAGEWLLDNYYLVRRVLGQLHEDLPKGFQKRLPRLPPDGEPRLMSLARALYDGGEEIDLQSIERFLDFYQSEQPLTIAELWAFPALLRLVILRRLVELIERLGGETLPETSTRDAGAVAGRCIRTLRLLAEIDWKEVFSRHSAIERILGEDPARAYPTMEFETRDSYRHVVEEMAWAAGIDEIAVVRAVLDHARRATADERSAHVGHWLFGAGRRELEATLGRRHRSLERLLLEHPRLAFFGLLFSCQFVLLVPVMGHMALLDAPGWMTALTLALCWFPSSVPTTTLTHWLLARLVGPRPLPKLDFSSGIPARFRTVVAVPTLLGSPDEIERLIAALEVRYLANPDPELRFALLAGFMDSDDPPGPAEAALLGIAERGILRLNERYGKSGRGPFHLLHRESRFNEAEGKWMGWERKRGKLQELNRYLRGASDTSFTTHVGDPEGLAGVAFVLTLDSDTELPPGAAARLVGALAHPLNRPVADERLVREGYTVIQPRVEISPKAARLSPFTKLFSGDTGIDIYTRAVSEVYQDLFGEGIYIGKGIYDVDAFQRSLEGRVPDNTLLSHDLFEGVHGRGALATDVVVYEDYPVHYAAYLHRLHRWIRGDWQLLPWLFPRVPKAGGGTMPNRLGLVDRFKIVDNLRRSLLAPSLLALLLCGWLVLPGHPLFWTLAAVLAPGATAVWTMIRERALPRQELGRWLLALCFAPQEARTVLDAVTRTLVRMFVTRRHLLEWVTAAQAMRLFGAGGRKFYYRRLWTGPATSTVTAVALAWFVPSVLPWAAPWLLLWLVSPEIAFRISQPSRARERRPSELERRQLRRVARRTWLFFETFVGPGDHWLPPDHFQEYPLGLPAHRTSPTNVAMGLLSYLAAYDLGYLGPAELASWVSNTLDTLEKLEKCHGHILNWYDTRTLEPLEPRYVSSVDSGNLAGALLALAAGLEELEGKPPFRPAVVDGLRDSAELLVEALERWGRESRREDSADAQAQGSLLLHELVERSAPDAAIVPAASKRLRAVSSAVLSAIRSGPELAHDPLLLVEVRLWLERLEHQLRGIERETPALAGGGENALDSTSRSHLDERLRSLAARARSLALSMDFRFLYDGERRLLRVGYNVTSSRFDPHHYDLLASEARLASYVAIATHQIPPDHWFALGRPLTRAGRRGRALVSWGGSMFEYLMPRLLMESHEDTLLHQSCEAAVERQIDYGSECGVPWGVSESGYAFLDQQEAYQYRSFGVPGLGLRRGLEEDVVVAPYACLLALAYRPREVSKNLGRFEALDMLGRFGFYEALDFHPSRMTGTRATRVRSYMSHHQGMGLVAIDNSLCDDVMVRRFHREPRIESWSLLLDERVPLEVRPERPVIDAAPTADVALTPHLALASWEPERHARALWALGNGELTSIVSSDGGGSLHLGKIAVSRGESDVVHDQSASFVYARDADTGELFGTTAEPCGPPEDVHVTFDAAFVEFRRRHGDLMIRTRVAVASEDTVELREIQIENHGESARRLEVVGTFEPVLEAERDMARHPAFSKLFLRCQSVDELSGVLVTRNTREAGSAPALVFRVVAEDEDGPRVLEIDREAFLGRLCSARTPRALLAPHTTRRQATLDPLCACAATLDLAPGARRSVAFVAAVAPSAAGALELARRLGSLQAVRWNLEDAGRAAARRIQRLGFPPTLLPAAQRLLSGLFVSNRSLRAPESALLLGRPSQRKLWGRGISGDEPICALRTDDSAPIEALVALVAMHRYLREIGIRFDLVIIDEAAGGYVEEGSERLQRLLAGEGAQALLHQRGGVHYVRAEQASAEELADLETAARVHLDARSGDIAKELARHVEELPALPFFQATGVPPDAEADPELGLALPALEFDNGYGGFGGDDYVIKPGVVTPSPWCNVLANEQIGCLVSESALGCTWSLNASENRLTPWSNDPILDPPSEILYVRDEETGRFWSTTPLPLGLPTLVRHGHGFTSYESVCAGLEQTMTVFVPPTEPVKIVRLRVRNCSSRARRLTATYYAEWVLGNRRRETAHYVKTEPSVTDGCLFAECHWSADFAGRNAFLASDRPLHGFTCDRLELLGRAGDVSRPAGLRRWGLSGRATPGADPCAALQVHLDLPPNSEIEVSFFIGQTATRNQALELVRRLRTAGAIDEAFRSCRTHWQRLVGSIRIRTPDPALDRLCNGWLLYQAMASRFLARTAFYQPGGGFGFRDQLQDVLAFVHADPGLVRAHLLASAAHQFVEGDVLHWWQPPGDAGVRTHCSDDLLWLVYATAEYVRATGDLSVLEERVPFLTGESLRKGERPKYSRFASTGEGTLLEHCRRAFTRGFTSGPHGLPLIGDGDWNDGMDRVGIEGRGESVWLGWFVHECTERLADLLERTGEKAEAERCRSKLSALRSALAEHGWDGSWFRRAYFDDGTPVGSAHSAPPHIDSIAQSWAALSGAADAESVRQALHAADRALVREHERLVLLLAPPFGASGPNPGYIAAYPAGVRENGGQYTHAAAWLGWAHVAVGSGRAAHRIFDLLNPLERTRTRSDVERYRVEPYVIAADIYGRDPFVGRGGWTWYTGAAAWTYRLAVEGILGLRLRDGKLEVAPCLPPEWDGFEAEVRTGDSILNVVVHRSEGERRVELDGASCADHGIPLAVPGARRLELWTGERLQTHYGENGHDP